MSLLLDDPSIDEYQQAAPNPVTVSRSRRIAYDRGGGPNLLACECLGVKSRLVRQVDRVILPPEPDS